jgi:hypothetical protein
MCGQDYAYPVKLPTCFKNINSEIAFGRLVSSWRQVDSGADVWISVKCDAGYSAQGGVFSKPAGQAKQSDFACVEVPTLTEAGLTGVALSSYTYRAQWTPVQQSAGTWTVPPDDAIQTLWFYELLLNVTWPAPIDIDLSDPQLSSIRPSGSVIRVPGDLSTSSFVVDTDTQKQTSQIRAGFSVRIANSDGEHGAWRSWSSQVQLPCECSTPLPIAVEGSAQLSPFAQLALRQLFNTGDELELQLQNFSPCTGSVMIVRQDQPSAPFQLHLPQPILRESQCPSAEVPNVQSMRFQLGSYTPGQVLQFTITRQPRTLSPLSTVRFRYNTMLGGSQTPGVQYLSFVPTYWATVSGTVRTSSNVSPQPVEIANATVHAHLGRFDGVNGAWNPVITHSAVTDAQGDYSLKLTGTQGINMVSARLRVWVERADGVLQHEYYYQGEQEAYEDLTPRSGRHYAPIDFADRSHLPLSGRVTSEPQDPRWAVFKQCGVEGVRVHVFLQSDVDVVAGKPSMAKPGRRPLRTTEPTRTDGKWTIAVPNNKAVVLIAADVSNTHVFRQSHYFTYADGVRTTEYNYHDLTTRTLKLRIYGGEFCQLPVGRVTPTFVHEGCGSRKLTMGGHTFGDKDYEDVSKWSSTDEYSGAPAVEWVVKLSEHTHTERWPMRE